MGVGVVVVVGVIVVVVIVFRMRLVMVLIVLVIMLDMQATLLVILATSQAAGGQEFQQGLFSVNLGQLHTEASMHHGQSVEISLEFVKHLQTMQKRFIFPRQ